MHVASLYIVLNMCESRQRAPAEYRGHLRRRVRVPHRLLDGPRGEEAEVRGRRLLLARVDHSARAARGEGGLALCPGCLLRVGQHKALRVWCALKIAIYLPMYCLFTCYLSMLLLVYVENLHCYEEMRGHRKAVSAIEFHPTWSRILFTSDSSATILIWDIGLPSYPNIQTHHTYVANVAFSTYSLHFYFLLIQYIRRNANMYT